MMIILFLTIIGILGVLLLLSRGKYDEYTMPLDEKTYPLKKLLPAAFFLLEKIGYKFNSKYDRKLLLKITELHGYQYAPYYLQVHWANKIAFVLLSLFLIGFIGIGVGPDPGFGVFSLILLACILYFTDKDLEDKIQKRWLAIQIDFPDFLNKLTLLINAGATVGGAWEKIVLDNKKISPLYQELETVLADIRGGKPETQAYEDFAKRCRMSEVTKFISVIVQNLRKGNSELVSILRLQANECWEMRKHAAKRLGEEASTKMLLPMMIMFLAVLIIVAVPAILAMQGI